MNRIEELKKDVRAWRHDASVFRDQRDFAVQELERVVEAVEHEAYFLPVGKVRKTFMRICGNARTDVE